MAGERERAADAAGRFLTEAPANRRKRRTGRRRAVAGVVLADGLLIYMILRGLIDQRYGVVILAGLSAYFGSFWNRKEYEYA